MRPILFSILGIAFIQIMISCSGNRQGDIDASIFSNIRMIVTSADRTFLMEDIPERLTRTIDPSGLLIEIDTGTRFQAMQGFGFALTGGSAQHIARMHEKAREALLHELFGAKNQQIGLSYIRITIGSSDLDSLVFSYNDLPQGEIDISLENFSIEPDRQYLIPLLLDILEINPDLKIMASPWSPPVWMKTNGSSMGGSLKPEYYDAYALYLLKYLEAMEEEGIKISAVTIQNEPLHPGNNPSMYMTSQEQLNFIKEHLGPLFRENSIDARIVVYDHNADRPDYPLDILNDQEARTFVDGSAFHLYGGKIDTLSEVHRQHPDKKLYFTEQWYSANGEFAGDLNWHFREITIGASRNWCEAVIEWNLTSRPDLEPHTDGGCTLCLGAITIDGDQVLRNAGYYAIGHASSSVPPGSIRVASSDPKALPNVAFITPENDLVILLMNDTAEAQSFTVNLMNDRFSGKLNAGEIASIVCSVN